jgi:hypothetical protein
MHTETLPTTTAERPARPAAGHFFVAHGLFDPRPLGVRVYWVDDTHRAAFFHWHGREALQVVLVASNTPRVFAAEYFSWLEVLKIQVWLEARGYRLGEGRRGGPRGAPGMHAMHAAHGAHGARTGGGPTND